MSRRVGEYSPSRGVERACGGIVESVRSSPYTEYIELASGCVARGWDEKARQDLTEAIKLNLINKKTYPFELLQRRFGLPCSRSTFRREECNFVRVLSGLCGFE